MMMDVDQAAKAMRDEEMLDFIEGLQSTDLSRHEDQWSAGAHLVKPAWMEWSLTPSPPLLSGEVWLEPLLGD